MSVCSWAPCGKEHGREDQEIHIRSRGDISFSACSEECEDLIIEDIYRIIREQQEKKLAQLVSAQQAKPKEV